MESLRVERLDQCGLLASVIKELGLLAMLDARLVPEAQKARTPGEAGAGMRIHGWGFAPRPLSWTPPFVANTPLDLLLQADSHADLGNRFTLGRTLAEVYACGGELVLSERALAVWVQEGLDPRFTPLDPTRFSLRGDDGPDSDAQAIPMTHGDAKDHRPD